MFYMNPSAEFELIPEILLKLLKPLYGLANRGEGQRRTLRYHILRQIVMSATNTYGELFYKIIANQLAGLCATHVDNCLQARNQTY